MKFKKGQALALILWVMSSVLVVGISIASRSISSLRISTQTERSQRAFNAAEAGIQEALRRDPKNLVSGQTLTFDGVEVSITSKEITDFTGKVFKDKSAQVGLTGGSGSGGLTVRWNKTGEPSADLEIVVVRNNGDLIKFYCSNTVTNRDCGLGGGTNGYDNQFVIPSSVLASGNLLRIIPRKNDASFNATGDVLRNSQSYIVESSATTDEGLVRKVQAVTSSPALPEVFDYSLYSGTDLQ